MAVWGVPTAHEDDAERAVRAALDLVEAVPAARAGIQARAGVLTGEAAVTLGATDQGMVAGDLVNTACRLQSRRSARHGAGGRGDPAGRSRGHRVRAGRASRCSKARAPGRRLAGGPGGRRHSWSRPVRRVSRRRSWADEELALLKDLYHATGREKRGRAWCRSWARRASARAGWRCEFLKYVDAEAEDFWLHHGRSPAYGEGLTFWALGEMVRQRAGLAETDDEATTRARVAAMVAEHVPDDGGTALDRARDALAARRSRRRRRHGAAVRGVADVLRAHRRATSRWPSSSRTSTGPTAACSTSSTTCSSGAEPPHLHPDPRPPRAARDGARRGAPGSAVHLAVPRAPARAGDARAPGRDSCPACPTRPSRAIAARADGIPLYAVETVRMLVADGRLVEEGGVYRPSGDLATLAVPETLTALIASRLDGLDPADRAIGPGRIGARSTFTLAGLGAVSVSTRELEPRLQVLVRRELLSNRWIRAHPSASSTASSSP